jgi:hypothetical protein
MEADYLQTKEELYGSLTLAYQWLFRSAIHSGHWADVRSSALASLCMSLREERGSVWLSATEKWILGQQVEMGPDKASWGAEFWDTSMALLSLKHLGVPRTHPKVKKALSYVESLYNVNNRCNWHDEPWETAWNVMAILEIGPGAALLEKAYNATKWFLSLQDSDGKIISLHYTAYLLLIGKRLQVKQTDKDRFAIAITNCTNYLLRAVSEETLWTGEAWSNGQILWALSISRKLPCENRSLVLKIAHWFLQNQGSDGNWSDVEDTASAILGLYFLLKQLERVDVPNETQLDTLMFAALRRNLETPVLCVKRKLVERHEDGFTSVNLSPRLKKCLVVLLGIASVATTIIALWDFVKGLVW